MTLFFSSSLFEIFYPIESKVQCATFYHQKNVNAFSPVHFTQRISHCVQRILLNYCFPSQKVSSTTFAKDENREENQKVVYLARFKT